MSSFFRRTKFFFATYKKRAGSIFEERTGCRTDLFKFGQDGPHANVLFIDFANLVDLDVANVIIKEIEVHLSHGSQESVAAFLQ